MTLAPDRLPEVTVRWLMSVPGTVDPVEEFEALLRRPAWQAHAACRGEPVESFVANRHTGSPSAIARARAVCGGCSVKEECLAYALAHDEVGIWGGTSESQRRQMNGMRPNGLVVAGSAGAVVRGAERGLPHTGPSRVYRAGAAVHDCSPIVGHPF